MKKGAAIVVIFAAIAVAIRPRKLLSVSQFADANIMLSSKSSTMPGPWLTRRNPPLREPMDCFSVRSRVRVVVLKFPIQFGKTSIAVIVIGYTIAHDPCPVMTVLPGQAPLEKWISQKLNTMIEETPAVRKALTTNASRDSRNRNEFKDFPGGQLYMEHAGNTKRMKSTTVKRLIVDEIDEILQHMLSGDDPMSLLEGRTSSYAASSQHLLIGTPTTEGVSRIDIKYRESDQRRFYVPCPHCGEKQPLEWRGLHWNAEATECWYVCRACQVCIDEHHKTQMIAAGEWVAENPEATIRGYTINCLYYPFGLGPRWLELVKMWIAVQSDPAKLKTFVNDRLAECWEDPAMRAVKHNLVRDRAEQYPLRSAPRGVLKLTAGVDTQDDRLAVHIVGWGRGMASWVLDYVELPGDPQEAEVWRALVELLQKPIEHASGAQVRVEASCIDAGGHRTEAVKNFCRSALLRRCIAIFGAVPNNAPALSKGTLVDVRWNGQLDKNGIKIYHVGTVSIKHALYARIGGDAEKQVDARMVHVPDCLPPEYFAGLVSETYDPRKNRFEKRRGVRNEPLDTWVYAYAATHHPELRMHRFRGPDWLAAEAWIETLARQAGAPNAEPAPTPGARATVPPPAESGGRLGLGVAGWNLGRPSR